MLRTGRTKTPLFASACSRATAAAAARSEQYIGPAARRRWNTSVAQKPGSDRVHFPGALSSSFTTTLAFARPSEHPAMPTYRILDQDGVIVDKSRDPPDVSDAEVLKMYEDMVMVSVMDLIMFDAQRQGRISFYMVSAGEEGIAVGSASALHPTDPIFAQYREAGLFKHRGFTVADFMNQLYANRHDAGLGRNMPVHYGSAALHIHTISSPLATQIPQATGAAYAVKLQDKLHLGRGGEGATATATAIADEGRAAAEAAAATGPRCVACYFGEGAASEGDFHAALNIAATRSCPVVFVCRNNGYAISTPTLEQYRGDGIASRGVGYGIDTVRVDGNDVLAVREVMARAREMCLSDGGRPVLVEAMSYRVSHHSTSDDSFAYRARVEVEDWKRRDNPITRLRKWMEGKGIWDEDKEREARSRIRKEVLDAFKAAEKEKRPALIHMMDGVYETLTEEQEEQVAELKAVIEKYPDEYDVSEFEGGLDSLKR